MKKRLLIGLIIIVVVAILVGCVACFFAFRELAGRNTLVNEINTITKENINMEIKSSGEYALIEKQVKEDCKLYFETIEKLNENYTAGANMRVVNINNYKNDGPEFNSSITELNRIKTENAEYIATLDSIVNDEKILERAQSAGITGKYLNIYKEFLVDIKLSEGIATTKTKDAKFSAYIDSLINLLTYMKDNSNEWFIENDELKSKSEIFINEYHKLLNETNIEL